MIDDENERDCEIAGRTGVLPWNICFKIAMLFSIACFHSLAKLSMPKVYSVLLIVLKLSVVDEERMSLIAISMITVFQVGACDGEERS